MRVHVLLAFLTVASAGAGSVREYRHDEWKSIVTTEPKPEYPYEARSRGIQGRGQFRIYFARDGHATGVRILKSTGHPLLDNAAVKAFSQWHATLGPRRELDIGISYALSRSPFPPRMPKGPPDILREFSN